jgi:hypothetical protein
MIGDSSLPGVTQTVSLRTAHGSCAQSNSLRYSSRLRADCLRPDNITTAFSGGTNWQHGCLSSRLAPYKPWSNLAIEGRKAMPTALAFYYLSLISLNLLQDETSSDFAGLGKELLGGFVLAVVVAIAYAFIKLRLRDKKPQAEFLSINSFQRTDEASKSLRE